MTSISSEINPRILLPLLDKIYKPILKLLEDSTLSRFDELLVHKRKTVSPFFLFLEIINYSGIFVIAYSSEKTNQINNFFSPIFEL